MDDRPKKKEVSELVTEAEVRASLVRCALLMKNSTLLARMPDGGTAIRGRYADLLAHARSMEFASVLREFGGAEDQKIEVKAEGEVKVEGGAALVKKEEGASAPASAAVSTTAGTCRRPLPAEQVDQQQYTDEQVSTYGMACILKSRAVRGDIYAELQRMYADNLSQSEIRRMADASSPNLLMSYDDTLAMERRFAALERQAMMRRIRERLLAAGEAVPDDLMRDGGDDAASSDEGDDAASNNGSDNDDADNVQYE